MSSQSGKAGNTLQLQFDTLYGHMPRVSARRRTPTQARSTATLQAIREASLQIIEQHGAKKLTTNHIAEVAGVCVGSVYQYYEDKYAIAADLCKQLLLDDLGELDRIKTQSKLLADQSLEKALRFSIQEAVGRHRKLYRRLKDYYLEIHWRFDFESYVAQAFPHYQSCVEWFAESLFKLHAHEIAMKDHGYAAQMLVSTIEGTIHAVLARDPDMILDDRFIDELTALCMGYLRGSCQGPNSSSSLAQGRKTSRTPPPTHQSGEDTWIAILFP